MAVSFNLIDQPWIPCLMNDGTACELSLGKVFAEAREIREIFDESPLVTVALHRLLLAVLHRNFGPAGTKEWLELWREGWNPEVLGAYFARWHERFDLFHPERPFYQAAESAGVRRKPVAILFQESQADTIPPSSTLRMTPRRQRSPFQKRRADFLQLRPSQSAVGLAVHLIFPILP